MMSVAESLMEYSSAEPLDAYAYFGFIGATPWTFIVLIFLSFIDLTIYGPNTEIEWHLGVEDLIGLSRVSKRFNRFFSHFIDTLLRDSYDGKRFLSIAKVVSSLSNPFLDEKIRRILENYVLGKFPKYRHLIVDTGRLAPTLQSFWQSPFKSTTAYNRSASSSIAIWVNRYHFSNSFRPSENEFLMMVSSQRVQVSSLAIVFATIFKYSPYCFDVIRRRLGDTEEYFDYQDVVAALSVKWYDPPSLLIVFDSFRVGTHEILWNIVLRGSFPDNDDLLLMFLEKPLVTGMQWTFYDKTQGSPMVLGSMNSPYSHPKFAKLILAKASKLGFSRAIRKVLKRKLK